MCVCVSCVKYFCFYRRPKVNLVINVTNAFSGGQNREAKTDNDDGYFSVLASNRRNVAN